MHASETAHRVRKDIEGLRAIAVLAVILNHMAPSTLRGGFVGVDVFFVISGYLIGLHLLQDLEAGRFSFLRFYARRARRILPALIVMLVTVWGLGWVILSGPEFSDLGKHIAAAALFMNNFLLWSQSGYFDAPSASKPLLHLWSLGIEEQFYLVVPFLLWLGSNGRHASIRWVLRLSAVSLLLTVAFPVASFYLPDTRFWELGTGVVIGYLSLRGPRLLARNQSLEKTWYLEIVAFVTVIAVSVYAAMREPWNRASTLESGGLIVVLALTILLSLLASIYRRPEAWGRAANVWQRHDRLLPAITATGGAILVGISMIEISTTDWPGPQTVFPVLGTALVIAAGPTSLTSRLLACRPLVFIGGISYPLYLWHWPALVLWKIFGLDASVVGTLLPVAGALLLAWGTKEFVENPVRFGRFGAWTVPAPQIRFVIVGLMIIGLVGASTVATEGYPVRFPPSLRALANWSMPQGDVDWRGKRCFLRPSVADGFAAECTPARRPGAQQILLWGDSHAAHLYPGLSSLHTSYEFGIVQWTAAGCPPTRMPLLGEVGSCDDRRANILQDMGRVAPDTVLLAADWERYMPPGGSEAPILEAIGDAIRWLQQSGVRRIVLFGPGPRWATSESADLFVYMLRKRLDQIPERIGGVSNSVRHLDAAMAALAAAARVEYVSVVDRLCDHSGCLVLRDRSLTPPDLLFRDHDHLTASGSRLLMEAAVPQIFGARASMP